MTDKIKKVRIQLKGNLGGYSTKLKLKERREKLKNLIKTKYPPQTVIRKLNVLYIFNKNKNPELAKKFRKDMKYIQRTFYSSKR